MGKRHIVHLSSVHHVSDPRVFEKECRSLADAGFDVTLIINADNPHEVIHGVRVIGLRETKGSRLTRMAGRILEVYAKARAQNADLYHFHDPELIPVGIALKLAGKHVVYDAHEHVAKQIKTKPWIPRPLRGVISVLYRILERLTAIAFLDAVVVADPTQISQFPAQKVVVVENYPILQEVEVPKPVPYADRENRVCYVGSITELRGVREMISAIARVNETTPATLTLAGRIAPPELLAELELQPGWEFVDYRGFLGRQEVYEMFEESRIGIVVIHPVPNYLTSQPVKLLEYMSAGLPVVVSDFPYYHQYVSANGCGIMVNPLNPVEIADAVEWLLRNPIEAREMGEKGRRVVFRTYSWTSESQKLTNLYDRVLDRPRFS